VTRGAAVGLAVIAFMFAEPWLRGFLDARPRPLRDDTYNQRLGAEITRPGRDIARRG
jgi:hypothetical protein